MKENSTVNIKRETKQVLRQAKPWIERLAQLGLVVRGIVYIIIGIFAVLTAVGMGGKAATIGGAFQEIGIQPFGKFLLLVATVGLLGYALWRFIEVIVDPGRKGTNIIGIIYRIGYFVASVAYIILALIAVRIMLGLGGSDIESPEGWTALVLVYPYGRWLIVIAGVIIIGVGLNQFYQAYTGSFRTDFSFDEMSKIEGKLAMYTGRLGFVAWGIIHGIIGVFLIEAALHYNAKEAGGLAKAFQTLGRVPYPYGCWILGIIALGFISFGIYSILMARYRRVFIQ
jgi:uncharacterized protein DUF1206